MLAYIATAYKTDELCVRGLWFLQHLGHTANW